MWLLFVFGYNTFLNWYSMCRALIEFDFYEKQEVECSVACGG